MQNFVQQGDVLDLVAPYNVTSGQGAQVGAIFGIATGTFTSGNSGGFLVRGVASVTAKTSQAWSQGDRLYWDNSNKWLSNTATDGEMVGVATAAKGSSAAVGLILLTPAPEFAEGQQAAIAALTDSSGGSSGGNTIAAITGVDGTGNDAASLTGTKNAVATLAAKVNAIQAALHAAGITG